MLYQRQRLASEEHAGSQNIAYCMEEPEHIV